MSRLDDLFGGNATEEVSKTSELYKVSYKNGKNGVYNSVIRFIPNPVDPTKSIYKKYVAWVKNPITNVGMYVDNFSSPTKRSPITDMYFKMINTKVKAFEDMAKQCLSSKVQYASFVQILSDENHPELVGQIKVFTYGQKIYDKLHFEEYPQQGTGLNPFHPVYGRHFALTCTNQSNFNNFDNSNFFDERDANKNIVPSGMWYMNPASGQMEIATENVDVDVLMAYLNEHCTDLSKYDYAESWTADQEKHVQEVIDIMNNYMLTGQLVSSQQAVMQQASAVLHTQSAPVFPGVSMPGTPATPTASPVASPVMPNIPSASPSAAAPIAPQQPAVTPQPISPTVAPVMPGVSAPKPTVTGVDIPSVTPQPNYGATVQAKPGTPGINMDDILSQL